MDYFLCCKSMEPPNAQEHFTEQLVTLAHLNTCYSEPKLPAPARSRADFGLPENVHLYICSQSLFKVHPAFDSVLRSILEQDPLALVVFLGGPTAHWKQLLAERFARTIPEPIRRVHFLPALSQPDFLHLQALADVLLDTFPFGGGNTSLEAFAFGTPVITLATHLLRGRITFACYRQLGLQHCIAISPEDYAQKAVRLATDPAWRQEVRKQILEGKHLLYDNKQAVRELEGFLEWAVNRGPEADNRGTDAAPG
jgi:predicted O-linked N-acetylglucosamine transferase (SPINDLY family)